MHFLSLCIISTLGTINFAAYTYTSDSNWHDSMWIVSHNNMAV